MICNIEVRVGALPSALGPFTHPLDLGQVMALAFVAVLTWRSAVRRSALTFCLLLGTARDAADLPSVRDHEPGGGGAVGEGQGGGAGGSSWGWRPPRPSPSSSCSSPVVAVVAFT